MYLPWALETRSEYQTAFFRPWKAQWEKSILEGSFQMKVSKRIPSGRALLRYIYSDFMKVVLPFWVTTSNHLTKPFPEKSKIIDWDTWDLKWNWKWNILHKLITFIFLLLFFLRLLLLLDAMFIVFLHDTILKGQLTQKRQLAVTWLTLRLLGLNVNGKDF